jgi:hypothetical protein
MQGAMAWVRGKAGRERMSRLRKVKDLIKHQQRRVEEREERGGAKEKRWAGMTELRRWLLSLPWPQSGVISFDVVVLLFCFLFNFFIELLGKSCFKF